MCLLLLPSQLLCLRRRSKEVDHGQCIGQRGAKGSAASQQHYGRPGAQRYTHYRKPRVRRVPQGLSCAIYRAHGEELICRAYKINTRRTKSTRRRQSSPCAPGQAHGEATVRRVPQPRHTAKRAPRAPTLTVVDCSSTPLIFAVCQRLAHGEPSSLPCASGQHTAT